MDTKPLAKRRLFRVEFSDGLVTYLEGETHARTKYNLLSSMWDAGMIRYNFEDIRSCRLAREHEQGKAGRSYEMFNGRERKLQPW